MPKRATKRAQKKKPAGKKSAAAKASRLRPAAPQGQGPSGAEQGETVVGLLRFADALRSNANEAMRFVEEKVLKKFSAAATGRTETRFITRTETLSREFLKRDHEFLELGARCPSNNPCRPLINDLDGGGLPGLIKRVAAELAALRSFAMSPLTEEEREQLANDARALQRNLTALLDLADKIREAAKKIRDDPVETRRTRPVLPPLLQSLVEEAEQAAALFYDFVGSNASPLERSSNETLVGCLSRLLKEKERLHGEVDKFTAVIQKFTDQHRASAEAAGHSQLLQFLRERVAILNRVAARRNCSIDITTIALRNVVHRLSLSDCGLNAADGIVRQLNGIHERLEQQRQLLGSMAADAMDERVAEEAAREEDLPEWNAIVNAAKGDGSKLAGLDMLVAAFQDDPDGGMTTFGSMTIKELWERLAEYFPESRPFSEPTVGRRLKDACGHKIVVCIKPSEGASKRIPHVFRLSNAAIRKYGPHVQTFLQGRT